MHASSRLSSAQKKWRPTTAAIACCEFDSGRRRPAFSGAVCRSRKRIDGHLPRSRLHPAGTSGRGHRRLQTAIRRPSQALSVPTREKSPLRVDARRTMRPIPLEVAGRHRSFVRESRLLRLFRMP